MFGNFVKGLFVFLGAVLPLCIFILTGIGLWSSASDALKERYQAVATDILVPMFTTVSGALFTAGIIKGILTHLGNASLPADQRRPVRFFDW